MLKSRYVNLTFLTLTTGLVVAGIYTSVPPAIFGVLVLVYAGIQVYGSVYLRAQFFVNVKYRGAADSYSVALTFDDGPIAGHTDRILDILKLHQVKAAFFCIGHKVRENPALVRRMMDEGHLIANHSYWHGKTFDLQSGNKIHDELVSTNKVINEVAGVMPNFFRPPYGVTNPMVAYAIKKTGLTTVGWTIRSLDTVTRNASRLKRRVLRLLRPGGIILFHDHSHAMLEILPSLIEDISKPGFKIVRLDVLINVRPYAG